MVGTVAEDWALERRGRSFSLQGGGRSGLTGDLCVCLCSCFSGMIEKQRSDHVSHGFDFFKPEWQFLAQTYSTCSHSWHLMKDYIIWKVTGVCISQGPAPGTSSFLPLGKLLLRIPLWQWVHGNAFAWGPTCPKAAARQLTSSSGPPGWEPASSGVCKSRELPSPSPRLCLTISQLTSPPF